MPLTRTVVNVNKLKEAYIRPLVFLGSEGMGLRAKDLKVPRRYSCLGMAFVYGP